MSIKQLTAYAMIGTEHHRLQQERKNKIQKVMETLTETEYEQMLELARKTGDEQMLRDLPIMRELMKK